MRAAILPSDLFPATAATLAQTATSRSRSQWGFAQPQPGVCGEIARALLYMVYAYGLPLHERMSLDMLRQWHHSDPADDEDR